MRGRRENFITQFTSVCNCLLLKPIPEHLFSSVNKMRVIETTWATILELASQQRAPKNCTAFSTISHFIEHLWRQLGYRTLCPLSMIWPVVSLTFRMNIFCIIYYELQVPTKLILQPSLCIFICSQSHLHLGSVLQVSEDEVNGIHCGLLLVFPAIVHEGRISLYNEEC